MTTAHATAHPTGTTAYPSSTPTRKVSTMSRHALSVLVENNPGVLARVSVLFARRSF